ncbi:MAG: ATP-grasp fold amidoligase family protein, partial [Enterococcus sp.]
FPFVRVDFFMGNGQLYLGELTFTPAGGLHVYPKTFDLWLGEQLQLPEKI